MAPDLSFKCKCGDFEAQIKGQPKIIVNCHCHCCVASARQIESKPSFSGISNFDGEGCAMAFFGDGNFNFMKDLSSDHARSMVKFVKVGEKGKEFRSYCSGCGTLLFHAWKDNFCVVNRNALHNADGTTFKPDGPIPNIRRQDAFDPSKVPDPSYNKIPLWSLPKFLPLVLGFGGKSNAKEKALFPEDPSKLEVVPISWEN